MISDDPFGIFGVALEVEGPLVGVVVLGLDKVTARVHKDAES